MKLERWRYLIMTVDPVHIGTGGYHLGRVDNSIVREAGTNLPKIPGTSLHGAIRSAAALRYGMPQAAGQRPQGGPEDNPIVYTFGAGEEGGFSSGVVNIYDATLLLFPVASQEGPVWITTKSILNKAGFEGAEAPSHLENVRLSGELRSTGKCFPLGWLMLTVEGSNLKLEIPSCWQDHNSLKEALSRTVIVHEGLFSELVNSGLEVRTSVAIKPETGAAEEGALFTYEAIPRATFLVFDVVIDDYREHAFPNFSHNCIKPTCPADVLNHGLELLEYLGLGGMGTRGFGRVTVISKTIKEV